MSDGAKMVFVGVTLLVGRSTVFVACTFASCWARFSLTIHIHGNVAKLHCSDPTCTCSVSVSMQQIF